MKKLRTLFTEKPGYMKCGNEVIAHLTGLKEKTIISYKRGNEYREAKKQYVQSLKRN